MIERDVFASLVYARLLCEMGTISQTITRLSRMLHIGNCMFMAALDAGCAVRDVPAPEGRTGVRTRH